ncbi:MAG: DUF835 domain-containing protein [Thermoplasmatota archaeon]
MEKKILKEYDPLNLETKIKMYWEKENIIDKIKETSKNKDKYYLVQTPDNIESELKPSIWYKHLLYDVWYKYQCLNKQNINMKYCLNTFTKDSQKTFLQELDVENIDEIKKKDNEKLLKIWKKSSGRFKSNFKKSLNGAKIWDSSEYHTSNKKFINSVWWSLSELYNEGLFKKVERDVWQCKNCNEYNSKENIVEETYTEAEYLLKVPVKRGKDRFLFLKIPKLLSLLAPLGIFVSPKGKYSVVSYELDGVEERGIVPKSKLNSIMAEAGITDFKEINYISGNKIHGMEFINPIEKLIKHRKRIKKQITNKILASDILNQEDEIKLVTPGITEDSVKFSDDVGIDIEYRVNKEEVVGKNIKYKGAKNNLIKDLDEMLEEYLKDLKYLLDKYSEEKKIISCPNCSSEVNNVTIKEWILITEEMENKVHEHSDDIEWLPEWGSPLEDYDSLEDIDNWRISSDKQIGIQLPIWGCGCGEEKIISSTDQLKDLTGANMKHIIFPHFIDNLDIECDDCGEKMKWEGKSIHHNFIKSISPWAQLGYPDNEKNFKDWWSGDLTFGKFMDEDGVIFGNLVLSSILFNDISIKKIATRGKIEGEINIPKYLKTVGSDSLRLAFLENSPIWEDKELKDENLSRPNKIIKVLWNIYNFYNQLKDGLSDIKELEDESIESFYENTRIEDKWILSRSQDIIKYSEEHLDDLRFDELISLMNDFVLKDIAQWYVGIVRYRVQEGDEIDRISVILTLEYLLNSVTRILCPLAPCITEKIYTDMHPKNDSVFTSDEDITINKFKNSRFDFWKNVADEVTNDVYNLKKEMELPLKWPFQKIVIDTSTFETYDNFEKFKHIIKNKAKIKEIEILRPDEEWKELELTVEANMDAIGKTYRQWASRIALLLENRDAEEIKEKIEEGEYIIGIEGHQTEIQPEMLTFKNELPEGYVEVEYDDFNVYANYEMSEDIWNEQIANEIKLRIKSMREDFDLLEEDEVEIFIYPPDEFFESINSHKTDILNYVGGKDLTISDDDMDEVEYVVEWDINGETVDIGINPLYKTNMLHIYQSIPGMSKELSERLYYNGYTSLDKLKKATAEDISDIRGFKRSLARRIVQTMKEKGDKLKKGEIKKEQLKSGLNKEMKRFIGELQKISGIGKSIAESITKKGYYSFEDIAETSVEKLMEIRYMKEDTAERLIDYSKKKHAPEIKKDDLKTKEPKESLEKKEKGSGRKKSEKEEKELAEELPEGINKSSTYMMIDENLDNSFELFKKIMSTGMDGICITREYPKKIRNKYDLEKSSIIWLSNVDKEEVIRPKNLKKLKLELEKFLKSGNSVILLSGIEYLIINNDFRKVLHLLLSLKDQSVMSESILLVQIDSQELDDYQLDLMKSEMDDILT